MKRILEAEKKEKRLILVALSLFLLIAGCVLFLIFRKSIVLVLVLFFVIILGIKMFFEHFLAYRSQKFPLTNMLQKEPKRIVWVYSIVTKRMPFGFQINQSGTMYFKLLDGDELTLSFPASELKSISEMLNYHLPHATFGYTKEREQWYMAHPELLLRQEDS